MLTGFRTTGRNPAPTVDPADRFAGFPASLEQCGGQAGEQYELYRRYTLSAGMDGADQRELLLERSEHQRLIDGAKVGADYSAIAAAQVALPLIDRALRDSAERQDRSDTSAHFAQGKAESMLQKARNIRRALEGLDRRPSKDNGDSYSDAELLLQLRDLVGFEPA